MLVFSYRIYLIFQKWITKIKIYGVNINLLVTKFYTFLIKGVTKTRFSNLICFINYFLMNLLCCYTL